MCERILSKQDPVCCAGGSWEHASMEAYLLPYLVAVLAGL